MENSRHLIYIKKNKSLKNVFSLRHRLRRDVTAAAWKFPFEAWNKKKVEVRATWRLFSRLWVVTGQTMTSLTFVSVYCLRFPVKHEHSWTLPPAGHHTSGYLLTPCRTSSSGLVIDPVSVWSVRVLFFLSVDTNRNDQKNRVTWVNLPSKPSPNTGSVSSEPQALYTCGK